MTEWGAMDNSTIDIEVIDWLTGMLATEVRDLVFFVGRNLTRFFIFPVHLFYFLLIRCNLFSSSTLPFFSFAHF
jgi:hypothetical protein